jgi:hypothetical protein
LDLPLFLSLELAVTEEGPATKVVRLAEVAAGVFLFLYL